ncbi:MAG: hypothetical protein NXI22_03295 [bacterium]|nr:hypothetical protein [bacterium]
MPLTNEPSLIFLMALVQTLAFASLILTHIFCRSNGAIYADAFFFVCLAAVGVMCVMTVKLGGPLFLSCALVLTLMAIGGSFTFGSRKIDF